MPTQYQILLGDEKITFEGPDGLSEQQITALADSQLKTAKPGESFMPSVFGGEVQAEQPAQTWEDMSYLERVGGIANQFGREAAGFVQGAAEVGDKAANLLEGGYNQTLGRVFGQSTSADTPAFQNAAAGLGEGDPRAREAGEFAGTAFLTRGMGAGKQGMGAALLESDKEGWGLAMDAGIGAIGGKLAEGALKTVGGVIAPVVDEAAQLLHKAGVKLTPGQAIPALREAEDKMISWPFVGSQIAKGRAESFEGFSRAPLDEALKAATGRTLPKGIKSGHQAVKFTGDRLSSEYQNLIPQLTFKGDQQLIQEVQDLGARLAGAEFAPSTRRKFEAMVRDGVLSRFQGQTGTGAQYQAADKYLTKQIERFGRSAEPENQAMAEALRDLQGALSGALHRSNPKFAEKLDALNRGWALLVPAESAAAKAKGGIFSPEQYRSAVRQADSRVRKRGMARGEARGQKLAEAGSEVLPSSFPNPSGTASHEAYSPANILFWLGAGARPLYNSLAGVTSAVALTPRIAAAQPIAEGVKALPAGAAGGILGSNALTALLPADR